MYLQKTNSCNFPVPISVCCHFILTGACRQWVNWEHPDTAPQTGEVDNGRHPEGFTGTQSTAGVQAFPSLGVLLPCCLKARKVCMYMLSDLDK